MWKKYIIWRNSEESFPYSSNLLFRSTFHRHCDLRLEVENLLLHSMYFFQKCPANYARPIMTRSWPNSRFDMTPHSPPILDTCQFRYVHCDENPCKINSIWLQIFSKHLRKFIFHEVQWNLIWNVFLAVRSC